MTERPDAEPLPEFTAGLEMNSAVVDDLTIAGESRAGYRIGETSR